MKKQKKRITVLLTCQKTAVYMCLLCFWLSLFFCSPHDTCTRPGFLCHTAAVAPSHTLPVSKKCNPSLTYLQVDFSDFWTEYLLPEGVSALPVKNCQPGLASVAQIQVSSAIWDTQGCLSHPPRAGRHDPGPAGHLRSSGAAAGDQVRYSRASPLQQDACLR